MLAAPCCEIYLSVALTLAIKGTVLPLVLLKVSRIAGAKDAAAMYLGPRSATIVALGLVLLAYGLVQPSAVEGTLITGSYFPTSVALVLVGGLTMVLRKKALIQVIGLIVVENSGAYVAAMAASYPTVFPPVVELGVPSATCS